MVEQRLPVAVLGATGLVGQRFVQLLDRHPWFEVVALTGSERSAGKTYAEACHWVLEEKMPDWAAGLLIQHSEPDVIDAAVIFSTLPTPRARQIEPAFAVSGRLVFSNASAYREEPDVPILLPEVNPEHIQVLQAQRARRGWSGGILTNANCTSTGMTVALKALQEQFGLRRVSAVSLQAISGAGYPGVAAMDMIDNVIPYIAGEEEKIERESRKILGLLRDDRITLADFLVTAQANRVPVRDGHLVSLTVECERPPDLQSARQALAAYQAPEISRELPSAPQPVIVVMDQADRPQPRLDRMAGRGMSTVAGRLRLDPAFGVKLVVLSHNTIRGAAGGSIYNAELAVKLGMLG